MRIIYRIARTELSLLFYSPIAWFVLIIFTFQSGLIFTDSLKYWLQTEQSMGNYLIIRWGGLTHIIFAYDGSGFYGKIQATLFLYIPLLTMSLMSRETSSGSIKLLMSSPIKVRQIVWGKFMSMMVYCFLFILIIFLYILAAKFSIFSMDFSMAMTGLAGTYLLICTYSAIGLFMSSLTSYQMVAAVSTFVTLAALSYIRQVGQNIGIVRVITYFASLGGQTQNLNKGLISSADITYFILIIWLFLCFTMIRLSDARSLRSAGTKVLRYAAAIAGFIMLEYVCSIPRLTLYYDSTANKNQTLSVNSQRIIKKLKTPLTITAYTNMLDDHASFGLPDNWNADKRFWEPYQRFLPDMEFKYVYYYDTSDYTGFTIKENARLNMSQIAKKTADAYGYNINMLLPPAEMRKRVNLKPEEYRFVRLLKSGEKKTYLRSFDDYINGGQPTEYETIAAIAHLVNPAPKIVFVNSEYERSILKNDPEGYRRITIVPGSRWSLINQGFDIDTLSLKTGEIPIETNVLVIADPKIAFSPLEMQKIDRYISSGGNMLIAAEAGRKTVLNPLLNRLGVSIRNGNLLQGNDPLFAPDRIEAKFSQGIGNIFDKNKLIMEGHDSLMKVALTGAAGLEYDIKGDFKVEPVLITDSGNTWNKEESFSLDTGHISYKPDRGDQMSSVPVALALTRNIKGQQQRIMVLGDADFMNNQLINYEGNSAFIVQMFRWFNEGIYPIDTDIKTFDNNFRIHLDNLSLIRMIFLGVIPITLGVYCTLLLLYRKRK